MSCVHKRCELVTKNPFLVEGKIECSFQVISHKVIVWPDPKPEKTASGLLFLPPELSKVARENLRIGTVISVGDGYYDKKKRRYIKTEVKPGHRVLFDNTTPWNISIPDISGKYHKVRIMTELDIKGIINCEDCIECKI